MISMNVKKIATSFSEWFGSADDALDRYYTKSNVGIGSADFQFLFWLFNYI